MTDEDANDRREVESDFPMPDNGDHHNLLPELVAHLREHRSKLREQWADRVHESHLLQAMTAQEMAVETTSVYDNYVEVLETGEAETAEHSARTTRTEIGSLP